MLTVVFSFAFMPSAVARKVTPQEIDNEYVVGSRNAFEPWVQRIDSRDHVERRLNKRAIDHLRLDAEIESDVSLLFDSVFADGVQVVAVKLDEQDPEYQEAKDIADFITKATKTARPIESTLKEVGKAAFYNGVKVAEIVLRFQDDNQINGKLVLDRINPKPISATAFVTDKFYNVLGLVGARRAGQTVVSSGSYALRPDEIIPREKFLVLSLELEDNDPRGLSQVRAAYEAWCDKKITRSQYKEWRKTSAIPKKVGITPEKALPVPVKNADGTYVFVDGVQKVLSPQQALINSLDNLENNSSIAAPFGTSIDQLEVGGEGKQFLSSIKFNNSEMRKVILGDALVTGEADKDARAARESSKDVSDIRKQAIRMVIETAVERDVFRLLTVINFGPDKAHLTPKCFLGDTEANDWATDVTAAAGAGYTFAEEHLAQLDAQFGLEPRDASTATEPVDDASAQPPAGETETAV